MGVNNALLLGVGNTSLDTRLGAYYQDISPAIYHFNTDALGGFDEEGIPYYGSGTHTFYSIGYVVQYALIVHEFVQKGQEVEKNRQIMERCLRWLDRKKEVFGDSVVWRSSYNKQYNLPEGWVSAMYQGQAISLYLRAYQLFADDRYLETAQKAFAFFRLDYAQGGATRTDENGYIWLEEYPTDPPSYVLNGFVYAILGVLDLYRATGLAEAKDLYEKCLRTLENNLHKYDVWYWSVYDQKKEQLVSYYYQKNVHIPLMEILFRLTGKEVFGRYAQKWQKNLDNGFHRVVVQVMYRVQPRLKKWFAQKK